MFSKKYVIRCDGGYRPNDRYCGDKIEGSLKGALKAEAKGLGWSFRRSSWGVTHICPACQAAARGEETDQ